MSSRKKGVDMTYGQIANQALTTGNLGNVGVALLAAVKGEKGGSK